jgi:two-component system sensor histidine kinase UhpB
MTPVRIFIVEDDPEITNLIKTFLTRIGCAVAGTATYGEESMLQIEQARPDLVLMDINLDGDLDGIQTAQLISVRFEIPVIFLTGLSDDETLRRSHEAQAFGYLLKPFDQDDLKASIDLALSKHKVESRLRNVDRWFAAAIKSISDAVITTDSSGLVTFVNPVAEALTGHAMSQAIGRPLHRVFQIADAHDRSLPRAIGKSQADGDGPFETLLIAASGCQVPIEGSSAPIKDDADRTIGRILAFRDISERRRAERELNESREHLRALAGHLQLAGESERRHIAREIHDEFGQLLTGLRMDLIWLEKRLGQNEDAPTRPGLRKRLAGALELVDGMVRQVRRISSELRPGVLDDLGLVAAMEWQAREWQQRTGIPCQFKPSHEQLCIPPEPSTALFRIFQEALTNVARHAHATNVQVELTADDESIRLVVSDNGRGLTVSPARPERSFGLLGMKERAALLGGRLDVEGHAGAGTRVSAEIPIRLSQAA